MNNKVWRIFITFLRLGLTSFGGPIAHLGYFRQEFVVRQRWISEQDYAAIVSLCQFLPGPASSQVGLIIGMRRAGHLGALAAWLGFTLPSAVALTLFAMGLTRLNQSLTSNLVHSLKIVAVAIVAQAVWGMARSLCHDFARRMIMVSAAVIVLLYPAVMAQLVVILMSGIVGAYILKVDLGSQKHHQPVQLKRNFGVLYLTVFVALLFGLPILSQWLSEPSVELFSSFYQAGSLVFGGGHVVLPLLQTEVVASGYVSNETFLAGYGAAQAVPGPLFTFAAFLGGSISDLSSAWYGSALCLVGIFLPSFLLVAGVLPFWDSVSRSPRTQSALAGVNAGVVGLLLAVLIDPLATSTIAAFSDALWVVLAFLALVVMKMPAWLIVLVCALIGLSSVLI